MEKNKSQVYAQEYDFALIVDGVGELNREVEDSLFNGGCDDATLSIQYGYLYMQFSRSADSYKDAIISAIKDVQRSGISARVVRVDECNLVTASEIARRIERSRQLIHQYITAERGPGGFPPPYCHLAESSPLWQWCAVSFWLVNANLLRKEEALEAEVVMAINEVLDGSPQPPREELVAEITRELQGLGL